MRKDRYEVLPKPYNSKYKVICYTENIIKTIIYIIASPFVICINLFLDFFEQIKSFKNLKYVYENDWYFWNKYYWKVRNKTKTKC